MVLPRPGRFGTPARLRGSGHGTSYELRARQGRAQVANTLNAISLPVSILILLRIPFHLLTYSLTHLFTHTHTLAHPCSVASTAAICGVQHVQHLYTTHTGEARRGLAMSDVAMQRCSECQTIYSPLPLPEPSERVAAEKWATRLLLQPHEQSTLSKMAFSTLQILLTALSGSMPPQNFLNSCWLRTILPVEFGNMYNTRTLSRIHRFQRPPGE